MCGLCSTKFAFLVFLLFTFASSAFTSDYQWNVGYMHHSPDGRESIVMGINGQFPGPTIRARAGDTLRINVTNNLHTEGVVIHWHGIRQQGTPWADGTASISQCAINPSETFAYIFKVDKPGTYFYHGHYGMQRSAGLYGLLIVDVAEGHKEPFHYNDEINLLLSDWWHKSTHEQEVGLSSNPMRWIGEPQSLLINGRGQFNCSLATRFGYSPPKCNFTGKEQWAPYILRVLPNKTYRIRIASSTALASLNFAIGNHKLEVVEADGNYVTPFTVNDLDIYSGDSYSVLLKTDQSPTGNYWVSVSVRGRKPMTPPALTILHYGPWERYNLPLVSPPTPPLWNNYTHSKQFTTKITALNGSEKPPTTYDRRIVLLNTQNTIDGYTKWAINNISLHLTPTPYLGSIKYNLGGAAFDQAVPPDNYYPTDYDIMKPPPNPNTMTSSGVYTLDLNRTIDIILQNANMVKPGSSEIHPWHLHGHDFWVLGYGEGKFTAAEEKNFNLVNPPLRNTAVIYPYGWTALRFVTDNPGVWAFHCHIEPHLHLGMGVILAEGVDQVKNMKIPQSALACGLTAKMIMGGAANSTG